MVMTWNGTSWSELEGTKGALVSDMFIADDGTLYAIVNK